MAGKAVLFSAPSGSGKTTIVRQLLSSLPQLGFSVSATTRTMREGEVNGKDYFFLSEKEFRDRIAAGDFVEWEEVYSGLYYGTLKSEVERLWQEGKDVVFDVDVKGGLSLKKYFGDKALAVFVDVPSIDVLRARLVARGTESAESLARRLDRAAYESGFRDQFDITIVNDQLDKAIAEAREAYLAFSAK